MACILGIILEPKKCGLLAIFGAIFRHMARSWVPHPGLRVVRGGNEGRMGGGGGRGRRTKGGLGGR